MSAPESPSSSPSLLASLPARPPTPPRHLPCPTSTAQDNDDSGKIVDEALRFLVQGHDEPAVTADPDSTVTTTRLSDKGMKTSTNMGGRPNVNGTMTNVSLDTPPPKKTTISPPKKVVFSPCPTYHQIPAIGQSSSPIPLPHQPPARLSNLVQNHVPRPLKSILKPSAAPLPCTPDEANNDTALSYFTPQDPAGFRQMLHSVLLQLEGPSRDARRDAYMAITGAIKSYSRVPDAQSLAEKMARLTQCLSRDLAWKDPTGHLDVQVVQMALSLTCAILFDPQTQDLFDLDFQAFVIDRSIFVLEQAGMAKGVVKGHLHLLCVQRFPRAAFGGGRAERLIHVMQNLEARNSMVAARLVIYQRLIERAPTTMLNRVKDWIEHIFHALLSSVNDVQRRAIDVCTQMGMLLGHHPQVAKAISELCEKELEEGQCYGDYLNMQLLQMTSDKVKAPLVPEIWVAVIMCFRSKRCPVGKWPKFRDWLLTIQKCLNSSDMAVKRPANIAWNRLVYAVMPDSSTSELLRSMLKVPVLAGLERRGCSELSHQLRQLSLDSYCNLIHYAMRPELAHEELDIAWDMYVGPVLTKISTGSKGRNTAFRVLHGLLKKTDGTWNANAANERNPIQPDDLPSLDVRWVRSRMARFMAVMEPLTLSQLSMTLDTQHAMDNCWRSLITAVADAGSQEVKASNELKDAIALIVNFLHRLWKSGAAFTAEDDSQRWLNRYQNMLENAVVSLGSLHFVDDILVKTSADDIEAAPTPSHRQPKQQPMTCSPFVLLFGLYYEPPLALRASGVMQKSAVWFLRLLAGAKISTSALLGLLQRSLQNKTDNLSPELEHIYGQLWTAVADMATQTLKMQSSVSPQRDTFVMGVALKATTSIILSGLRYREADCQQKVVQMYNAACHSARHVASDGGIVLAVMEPLARLIVEQSSQLSMVSILRLASTIAESGVWPSTRSELDESRKALWTVSLEPCKMQVFDPFDHVYSFFSYTLESSYQSLADFKGGEEKLVSMLMSSLASFLQRCPPTLFQTALDKLQRGYATWAEDHQGFVFPSGDVPRTEDEQSEKTRTLQLGINESWSQLLSLVTEKLSIPKGLLLDVLEPLLIAGFSSRSNSIVNATIGFWNSTFAKQQQLDYPVKLSPVLRARQIQSDLTIPEFPRLRDDVRSAGLPVCGGSQAPAIVDRRHLVSGNRATPLHHKRSSDNFFIKQHLAAQCLPSESRSNSSESSETTTRPKTDDSQAHFTPVEPLSSTANPEPQLWTARQQEVRARQRDDAQAYAWLPSSPLAPPSVSREHIPQKLKFVSDLRRTETGDIVITPKGARDVALFNDDIQSSPTPSRGKESVSSTADCTVEIDEYSELHSSPPELATGGSSSAVMPAAQAGISSSEHFSPQNATVNESTNVEMAVADSDLPSDTQLPSAQLQLEEEAAVSLYDTDLETRRTHVREYGTPKNVPVSPETPSRIEDTILNSRNHIISTPSDTGTTDSKVSRSSRKRKRTAETAHIARKRKPASPFNTFMSLFSNAQEEQIGEEIVVATNPSASSPHTEAVHLTPVTLENALEHDGKAIATLPEGPSNEGVTKRKRGRPRKSESQDMERLVSAQTRGRKRASSALSADGSSGDTSSQRKQRRRVAHQADQEAKKGAMAPAHITAVDEQTASPQLEARQMAQPQSILGRLRGLLADCKNMILGSQEEEREFDDVLFEIRREVHQRAQY